MTALCCRVLSANTNSDRHNKYNSDSRESPNLAIWAIYCPLFMLMDDVRTQTYNIALSLLSSLPQQILIMQKAQQWTGLEIISIGQMTATGRQLLQPDWKKLLRVEKLCWRETCPTLEELLLILSMGMMQTNAV